MLRNWKLSATTTFFFLASLLVTGSSLAQDSKTTVKAVGLSITLPDPDNEFGQSFVMGRAAGVEVTLMVEDKNLFFLAVVDEGKDKTELKISVDGKPLENKQDFSRIGFMSNISPDGHRVTLPVNASEIPPAGTKELEVSGTIGIMVGSDSKKEKVSFKPVVDEKVKLGGIETKIASVEEQNFGEPTTVITFESQKSLDTIQSIKFLDEAGKEIQSSSGGSSSFGFGGQTTYSRAYQIAGSPKTLSAEIAYFGSNKTIKVPVDCRLDLGISKK
jgi:hypothetical protein